MNQIEFTIEGYPKTKKRPYYHFGDIWKDLELLQILVNCGEPEDYERIEELKKRITEVIKRQKRVFNPKENKINEGKIAVAYMKAAKGKAMFLTPVELEITLYFPVPINRDKKTKALMLNGIIRPDRYQDVDNNAKLVMDALNGLAYPDDRKVVGLKVSKFYDLVPRVEVKITELDIQVEEEKEEIKQLSLI